MTGSRASTPADVFYDATRRSLRLASRSERTLNVPAASLSTALSKLELVPGAAMPLARRPTGQPARPGDGDGRWRAWCRSSSPHWMTGPATWPWTSMVSTLALGSGAVVMLRFGAIAWDPCCCGSRAFPHGGWPLIRPVAPGSWIACIAAWRGPAACPSRSSLQPVRGRHFPAQPGEPRPAAVVCVRRPAVPGG